MGDREKNWIAIADRYVCDPLATLRTLSEEYKVSKTRIHEKLNSAPKFLPLDLAVAVLRKLKQNKESGPYRAGAATYTKYLRKIAPKEEGIFIVENAIIINAENNNYIAFITGTQNFFCFKDEVLIAEKIGDSELVFKKSKLETENEFPIHFCLEELKQKCIK